jgi:hypothetical protein
MTLSIHLRAAPHRWGSLEGLSPFNPHHVEIVLALFTSHVDYPHRNWVERAEEVGAWLLNIFGSSVLILHLEGFTALTHLSQAEACRIFGAVGYAHDPDQQTRDTVAEELGPRLCGVGIPKEWRILSPEPTHGDPVRPGMDTTSEIPPPPRPWWPEESTSLCTIIERLIDTVSDAAIHRVSTAPFALLVNLSQLANVIKRWPQYAATLIDDIVDRDWIATDLFRGGWCPGGTDLAAVTAELFADVALADRDKWIVVRVAEEEVEKSEIQFVDWNGNLSMSEEQEKDGPFGSWLYNVYQEEDDAEGTGRTD